MTTTGDDEPVDRGAAVAGIQELFDRLAARAVDDRLVGDGESLHVHCTDGDGEWTARLTPAGLTVERVHGKGDVAVRGPAADVLAVLRGRLDAEHAEHVEVFGDAATWARWQPRLQP